VPLYVVDSNVAVKWTAMEPLWEQSRRLLEDDDNELIAPTSFLSETLNALVKKYRTRELTAEAVRRAQTTIESSVALYPVGILCDAALALSLSFTITVHDAMFLALALREDCALVTDDRRFMNAAGQHFPETFRPLSSLPGL
jgi:predicted nucleic acid-binding protein